MWGSVQFKRLLVAVDASENSVRASGAALAFAEKLGAELIILHVIVTPRDTFAKISSQAAALAGYRSLAQVEGQRILDQIAKLAESGGVKVTTRLLGYSNSVVQSIVEEAANEEVDLIVIGRRGLSKFKQLLLGSVSAGVVNHAHCSVLVVR
jgi:nucleotide-binding universal stress UspA family protein